MRFLCVWVAAFLVLAPAAYGLDLPEVNLSKPLTADQCVQLALERNYSIWLAKDRLDQAKATKLQAWGGFFPTLTASWTYTHDRFQRTQRPPSPFQADEPLDSDTRGYSITASQTLVSLPNLLSIAAEKKATGAAEADVRDAEQAAALAVRQQYYNLIESIKLLEVNQEDLRLAREEQRRTQSLFDVGSVARTDVLKASVRVAEAQSALTRAENTVQLERARLAKALALPAGADIKVVESLDPRPEMPDSAASYSEAAENRPDLKAARLRVDQTKADRKAALTSKLPFLSHSFNRSFSRSPGDGVVDFDVAAGEPIIGHITETLSSWNYRIGVTWNILDGLVTEGNIQRAKALVLSAEHELADLDLQVGLEVKQALLTVRDARQQIVTAREALVAAEEDLKLSQERYSVGLGTILELIDAQVKRTRARTGEVQAMAQLKRAEAQLDKATGRRAWQ